MNKSKFLQIVTTVALGVSASTSAWAMDRRTEEGDRPHTVRGSSRSAPTQAQAQAQVEEVQLQQRLEKIMGLPLDGRACAFTRLRNAQVWPESAMRQIKQAEKKDEEQQLQQRLGHLATLPLNERVKSSRALVQEGRLREWSGLSTTRIEIAKIRAWEEYEKQRLEQGLAALAAPLSPDEQIRGADELVRAARLEEWSEQPILRIQMFKSYARAEDWEPQLGQRLEEIGERPLDEQVRKFEELTLEGSRKSWSTRGMTAIKAFQLEAKQKVEERQLQADLAKLAMLPPDRKLEEAVRLIQDPERKKWSNLSILQLQEVQLQALEQLGQQ
jgi:hypothetical protein